MLKHCLDWECISVVNGVLGMCKARASFPSITQTAHPSPVLVTRSFLLQEDVWEEKEELTKTEIMEWVILEVRHCPFPEHEVLVLLSAHGLAEKSASYLIAWVIHSSLAQAWECTDAADPHITTSLGRWCQRYLPESCDSQVTSTSGGDAGVQEVELFPRVSS